MALSRPLKEDRRALPSFYASLLQAIDGAMFLVVSPHVECHAPHHFRSSETQATCDGCLIRHSTCSVIFPRRRLVCGHSFTRICHVSMNNYWWWGKLYLGKTKKQTDEYNQLDFVNRRSGNGGIRSVDIVQRQSKWKKIKIECWGFFFFFFTLKEKSCLV